MHQSAKSSTSKKENEMKRKGMCLIVSLVCILGLAGAVNAEWHFGVGTGITALNIDGDMGLNVNALGIGPVKLKVDMSPSDVMDVMDKAYGLGLFASDGKWMIQTSFSKLELEDDPAKTVGVNTIRTDLSFDVTKFYLTVGYPIYADEGFILRGYTGLRYNKHDLGAKANINAGAVILNRDIEEDWTDALVGLSVDIPFAEKWSWNTMFDAGFGGSEGSYFFDTGITWRFAEHWSTTLFGQYYAVEFENGSKGDADWYLYDVDEGYLGLRIGYIF
jgi:hypothetical protein